MMRLGLITFLKFTRCTAWAWDNDEFGNCSGNLVVVRSDDDLWVLDLVRMTAHHGHEVVDPSASDRVVARGNRPPGRVAEADVHAETEVAQIRLARGLEIVCSGVQQSGRVDDVRTCGEEENCLIQYFRRSCVNSACFNLAISVVKRHKFLPSNSNRRSRRESHPASFLKLTV